MFMCSGQLFSQGESARSWQTPGAAAMGAQMILKFVMEVPHGGEHRIGRRLPQPAQVTYRESCARVHPELFKSSSVPFPRVNWLRMRRPLSSPTRQGTHLPQDSEWVNSMK